MAREYQTECPHCTAILAVDPVLLRARDARVRCGDCLVVFNAREHLLGDATQYLPPPNTLLAATSATANPPTNRPTAARPAPPVPANKRSAAKAKAQAKTQARADKTPSTRGTNNPGDSPPARRSPSTQRAATGNSTTTNHDTATASRRTPPPSDTPVQPAASASATPAAITPASVTTTSSTAASVVTPKPTPHPLDVSLSAAAPHPAEHPTKHPGEPPAATAEAPPPSPPPSPPSAAPLATAGPTTEPAEPLPQPTPQPQAAPLPPHRPTQRSSPRLLVSDRFTMVACAIVATLAMALYLGIRFRANLAQTPWRPVAVVSCWISGCAVDARVAADKFEQTRSRMYSHPTRDGVLVISLQFSNQAGFAQPLPQIQLSVRDRNGIEVARGAFGPERYYPSATPTLLVEPDAVIDAQILIRDPGTQAVGFDVSFSALHQAP